ncbi:hypothetical protein P691DRAFT_806342 [Macrolepiota fuliginosa MF-IS2]|uniref:Nephrocystin 3-like N-terminal domain-containing protein n=1 Tax=Macrolepiota fuliginosa MF-IS2 TaxID=1400762 RepID=A0A9P6C0V3_9AGAR|nr:hypothetical protein P691DRAFT_806342 [Macrolepiota fuliginosa MF-IS2]
MAEVVNINTFPTGEPALKHLAPYTEPGAAMDSSARNPPPKCHPGTREKIGRKLGTWLDDHRQEPNMMWLHGPAGTGKSAIAQTFAEHCYERGRLGAAFFFSRPNERNKPETVIPTLAYQLAFHCRSFNAALSDQLASDPQWMTKAPHVQLKRLIIEPLSILQAQEDECIRKPFMIILDGLDECEGERAQFDFVGMINEASQLNLPLLWLICSRPEAHLQYTFSRVAYCGREKLLLDDECRRDVDRYLHDELARIKDEYADITPALWPSEDQFDELSSSASGLFVFASTGVKYIGDPTHADPVNQLKKLLSFLKHADAIGANNPLATLDLLYTQILNDVPEEKFPTTQRILGYLINGVQVPIFYQPTQVVCNFLHIDKSAFYSALRKLHSVIAVPAPEDASKTLLRFHHASFQDFLKDPNRSGRFVADVRKASVDAAKLGLFWHSIDTTRFHTNDGWHFDGEHRHASLPDLKWVSPDNEERVSRDVAVTATQCFWVFGDLSNARDEDLFSLAHGLDFRYVDQYYFPQLADWLYREDPTDSIVRTKPSNELDMRLLEYLRTVIGQGRADPATFPWKDADTWASRRRTYFFIGHGEKTTIVCVTECRDRWAKHTLNLDKEPTPQQIQEYQNCLVKFKWSETPDYEERAETVAKTAEGENGVVSVQ